jgi:hypothetical protein
MAAESPLFGYEGISAGFEVVWSVEPSTATSLVIPAKYRPHLARTTGEGVRAGVWCGRY